MAQSIARADEPLPEAKTDRIFRTVFAELYPLYIRKAERKGRSRAEVDEIICWLTGYDAEGLAEQLEKRVDVEAFFSAAPRIHPNSVRVRGVVCGVRVEDIEDPLMRGLRRLDKLIDELAKGRPMEKILRGSEKTV